MKKTILFLIAFIFIATITFSQKTQWCTFDFDNTFNCWEDTLRIDTISNPANIWEIGQPSKTIFNSAFSFPNAIVTKLDTSYPPNDTSSFIITHQADMALGLFGIMDIYAYYQVNSDTLTDYGSIEFSPDNGHTWINFMTDTVFLNMYQWYGPKPFFSGNSNGWKQFAIGITDYNHIFQIVIGDTILWKFTFISDSVQTFKDGWMLDNIELYDMIEGVPEVNSVNIISNIFPNPATTSLTIQLPQKSTIQILNIQGQVIKTLTATEKETTIDISGLASGIYIVKAWNEEGMGVRRFVKE